MRSVIVEQAIRAPSERIWQACSSASGLRSWQADEAEGKLCEGGELVLGWPALGVAVHLSVERVESQRRIVLAADDSELELEIGEGRVLLTHRAEFDDDECAGTSSSWRLALATLAHYLEQHDGQTRRVHWAIARAQTNIADAHAFFTLAGAQSGWLTRTSSGTGIADEGSEVALDLAWGGALSGQVLSHSPPRDALISWRETNQSLLALRTLPSPDSSHERLLIATWSSWGLPETQAIADHLSGAIARLGRILGNRATA